MRMKGLGADPPFAGGGAVDVDATVLHALIEHGQIQLAAGDGVGEQDEIRGAAGGAGGGTEVKQGGV